MKRVNEWLISWRMHETKNIKTSFFQKYKQSRWGDKTFMETFGFCLHRETCFPNFSVFGDYFCLHYNERPLIFFLIFAKIKDVLRKRQTSKTTFQHVAKKISKLP
jgi:hypothetical protein